MKTNYDELPEFSREFKRLSRKYRSLPDDLEEFKRVINIAPLGNSKHFNVITRNEQCAIVKARFFCRYLKGSSLRIVYAFHFQNCRIEFIEIYPKSEKENEDCERIKEYLKNQISPTA
jgi:mRNA-degrading endonuclease RelE of RelBE toxin-antitoxin system